MAGSSGSSGSKRAKRPRKNPHPSGPPAPPATHLSLAPEFVPGRPFHVGVAAMSQRGHTPSSLRMSKPPANVNANHGDTESASSPSPASNATKDSPATSQSIFDDGGQARNAATGLSTNRLPPGAPTAPSAHRHRHIPQNNPTSGTGNPPPNAPSAPAALRRGQAQADKQVNRGPMMAPAAQTPYSTSNTWTSREKRLEEDFQKLRTNLKHLGASNSPAVPQTPREHTFHREIHCAREIAFERRRIKIAQAENTQQQKIGRPSELEEELSHRRRNQAIKLSSFGLSPVFHADTCWNPRYTEEHGVPNHERVEWPSLSCLKAARRKDFREAEAVEAGDPHWLMSDFWRDGKITVDNVTSHVEVTRARPRPENAQPLPRPRQNSEKATSVMHQANGPAGDPQSPGYARRHIRQDRLGIMPVDPARREVEWCYRHDPEIQNFCQWQNYQEDRDLAELSIYDLPGGSGVCLSKNSRQLLTSKIRSMLIPALVLLGREDALCTLESSCIQREGNFAGPDWAT